MLLTLADSDFHKLTLPISGHVRYGATQPVLLEAHRSSNKVVSLFLSFQPIHSNGSVAGERPTTHTPLTWVEFLFQTGLCVYCVGQGESKRKKKEP
jgi:hypothetical protein